MDDTRQQSITSADRYLRHLRASRKGLNLPVIPQRCVISYVGPVIDLIRARHPHRSCSLGFTNPMEVHFLFPEGGTPFAVARGMHGAPMAAVLLEELIALGFEEFLVVGPAGHPTDKPRPEMDTGELLLVTDAWIFEGTSAHYGGRESARPVAAIADRLRRLLRRFGVPCREGAVATTDALYRETDAFVKRLVGIGAAAVDMEMSALFTVANFHARAVGGLVFISDVVSTERGWSIGIPAERFDALVEQLAEICLAYAQEGN